VFGDEQEREWAAEVIGFDSALLVLGAAGATAALVAFAARRRNRRRNELVQSPDGSQLRERRIEVVAIDDPPRSPIPDPNLLPDERSGV
jgi:hypothetical protein